MVRIYAGELLLHEGNTYQRKDYEGTHAERLAHGTSRLRDCDTWFETDTFKLYFWNEAQNEWITRG